MKRMIALMLAVLMVVGLFTGCGKQEAPAPEKETSSNQEASKPAETPAEPEKE